MFDRSEFAFIAGSPALDFLDTFGDRAGVGVELLKAPPDLQRWLEAANVVVLDHRAVSEPDLSDARRLRDALHAAVASVIDGETPPNDALDVVHGFAAQPPLRPRLVNGHLRWNADLPVAAALSTLSADGLTWLDVDKRMKLRRCPGCAMVFADLSPPGRRQWCSSQTGCGNRAKVSRHRRRHENSSSLSKAQS